MTKRSNTYKTFTREFKLEAVRLMETSDRPAAEIARELGIPRNRLYKWKEQLAKKGEQAFGGAGRPKQAEQSELATLKRENERLKEENEILKKAAAYFAKELK
jgi:transposase